MEINTLSSWVDLIELVSVKLMTASRPSPSGYYVSLDTVFRFTDVSTMRSMRYCMYKVHLTKC